VTSQPGVAQDGRPVRNYQLTEDGLAVAVLLGDDAESGAKLHSLRTHLGW
jgi:hypothetical protein